MPQKLSAKLLLSLRKLLIRHSDTLVKYQIDGCELLLPLSHDLPLYRKFIPEYSENIGRIAALVHQKYPDMTFIDIGANIGDTVAILRSYAHFPVLCIEGDPGYFAILERNLRSCGWTGVDLANVFVGDATGTVQCRVDRRAGSAGLIADDRANITTETLSDILCSHPNFSTARMLKIDTDGFDCRILRSSAGFLASTRPVIFFEYDPCLCARHDDDAFGVFAELLQFGYSTALFYDNEGAFLASADLQDKRLLEDLHNFYVGKNSTKYADICAFHGQDRDLANSVRANELEPNTTPKRTFLNLQLTNPVQKELSFRGAAEEPL